MEFVQPEKGEELCLKQSSKGDQGAVTPPKLKSRRSQGSKKAGLVQGISTD